jgi:hypothetical protein
MRSNLPRAVLVGALVFLGGAGSCGDDPTGLPAPAGRVIVAFGEDLDRWPADPWDFQAAELHDGSLHLTVAFGGGCRTHRLWLLAIDGFRTLRDAGPTPTVAVPIRLAHDADNDPCDAYVTRTEAFDLDPLRQAFRQQIASGPGRILLRIPRGQGSADTTTVDFLFP